MEAIVSRIVRNVLHQNLFKVATDPCTHPSLNHLSKPPLFSRQPALSFSLSRNDLSLPLLKRPLSRHSPPLSFSLSKRPLSSSQHSSNVPLFLSPQFLYAADIVLHYTNEAYLCAHCDAAVGGGVVLSIMEQKVLVTT